MIGNISLEHLSQTTIDSMNYLVSVFPPPFITIPLLLVTILFVIAWKA